MDTPYGENDPYHISTGHLPSSERLQSLVDEAYRRFRSKNDGELARRASIATPVEATDLYTRLCSRNVRARNLAAIGATLADGGAAIAQARSMTAS